MAKVAITLPEGMLEKVDRIARERGESRSGFIQRVLGVVTRTREDAEITRRFDALFATPRVAEEQLRVAEELDAAGTDWSDERW